jgi:geranylgeranyl pyrophosphate synthase
MARLAENVRDSDAIQRAMEQALRHIDRALVQLDSQEPSPQRQALQNLARYIVDRNS